RRTAELAGGPGVASFAVYEDGATELGRSLALRAAVRAARGELRVASALPETGQQQEGSDVFVDVCGLAPIHAESGFYEAWLVHLVRVPDVAPPDADGHAAWGAITQADADALASMGRGANVPGAVFTRDGNGVDGPELQRGAQPVEDADGAPVDLFDARVLAVPVSLGAFNTLRGQDGHAHTVFDVTTNWTYPLYELAATGGSFGPFSSGGEYAPLGLDGLPLADSRVPGSGPSGVLHATSVDGKTLFGDDPANPRDPDQIGFGKLHEGVPITQPASKERRLRGIPSGLAREILLDAFLRPASSGIPGDLADDEKLFEAYAREVKRFDRNGDGVIQFEEATVNPGPPGSPIHPLFADPRLFLPIASFGYAMVTRELDDGLLAPRFAPLTNAVMLEGPVKGR
ncbi:MAG TPA: hypothetical protein VHB21_02360, partial [Minicystis sp.]|nr:hypothetical protein [Minicystis sp.]